MPRGGFGGGRGFGMRRGGYPLMMGGMGWVGCPLLTGVMGYMLGRSSNQNQMQQTAQPPAPYPPPYYPLVLQRRFQASSR